MNTRLISNSPGLFLSFSLSLLLFVQTLEDNYFSGIIVFLIAAIIIVFWTWTKTHKWPVLSKQGSQSIDEGRRNDNVQVYVCVYVWGWHGRDVLSNVSTAPGNGVLLFCHIDIDLFMINAFFCSSPLKGPLLHRKWTEWKKVKERK